MHNDKEQEMTSPMNHSQGVPSAVQGEGFVDDDLDSQTLGNTALRMPCPPPVVSPLHTGDGVGGPLHLTQW